jgi:hypothetical protein
MDELNVEAGDGTIGAAKIGGKGQLNPPMPLLPQRDAGPLHKHLQVHGKMICFHPVR